MKKKGKENLSYVGLEDDYDNGDDDNVNDDDGDHESQDLQEYGNGHASRQHSYALRNDSDSFHHDLLGESDIESINSSHIGRCRSCCHWHQRTHCRKLQEKYT